MSRTGENIYKRADGRWEGRYIKLYDGTGKAKYGYVYAKTYTETKAKLCLAISEKQQSKESKNSRFLFSEIAEKWLWKVKSECKITTYNKYRNTYEKIIFPFLGKYPLDRISTQMMDSFVLHLLSDGKRGNVSYSPKSAQEVCMEIKQIVKYAEETYHVFVQCKQYIYFG